VYFDEDFIVRGSRLGKVFIAQNGGRAVATIDNALHHRDAGRAWRRWAARRRVAHCKRQRKHADCQEGYQNAQDFVAQFHEVPRRMDRGSGSSSRRGGPIPSSLLSSVSLAVRNEGSLDRKRESLRGASQASVPYTMMGPYLA
jgi:hypothetical protein